ncbi:Serine/threonine protein kinase [Actinacidiphila yanglinensis]|uniref:non-specific serine/threonine protein kinase n=1 Tax=Actinacidiphila yanglinensis TaxID=310779 RepID=A0A1H5YPK6_9ACTN|nr:Serine/threonine protein kinase [Actinacidiphila yanglinensis]
MRRGGKVGARYRLTKGPIRGGSGEVWLAHDEELGRDVVLKRVLGGETPTGFDRLRAEARVLARFSHAHVVTLHDAVRVGRRTRATTYLVMEYAPGGSLDHRPCLPPRLAAHLGAQIADALTALHAEGIVHGDIKPGNVVATGARTVKLADFGAAYRVGGKETITPNSAIGYTPDYAAPEVIRGQPEPASDVFSLAAMVYALIAGAPPRPPGGDGAGAYRIGPEARRTVELAADVGALREPLMAMLRRDPGARPTAEQARELLRAAAGPPAELPALPDPLAEPAPDEGAPDGGSGPAGFLTLGHGNRAPHGAGRFVRDHGRTVVVLSTAVVVLAAAAGVWALAGGPGGASAEPGPSGRPAPGSPAVSPAAPAPAGSGSAALFGDERTADPCALAKPSAMSRYGDAELDAAYGNFDRCDVIVDTTSGPRIDIEVEFVDGSAQPTGSVHTTGRVRVVDEPADGGECDRTLLLDGDSNSAGGTGHGAGGVHAVVTAKPADDSAPSSAVLCGMADTATAAAVDALNAVPADGRLPRRDPPLPPASLVNTDACTLLTPAALEVVPGIDAGDPDVTYGNWDCSWESTTSDLDVDLAFDRGEPPTADDGSSTRLGGHRAFVAPPGEDGDHTAVVEVVYRTYTGSQGDRLAETLELEVSGSAGDARLRSMATELAASAAAQLPAR